MAIIATMRTAWTYDTPDIALGQMQFSAASDSISACFQRGSDTQAVRQWDRQTGRLIREFSWSLRPDRSTVNALRPAVISGDHLWRWEGGGLICHSMQTAKITAKLPYPDLHDFATATNGDLVVLCEKQIQWLDSDGAVASRCQVESSYGASIAHATADSVFVLEPRRILRVEVDGSTSGEVHGTADHVAISQTEVLSIAEETGLISIYCTQSGQLLKQTRREPFSITSIASLGHLPIFVMAVSSGGGSSLEIYHSKTLECVSAYKLEHFVRSMFFIESTRQLAILARRNVQLFDIDERIMLTSRC